MSYLLAIIGLGVLIVVHELGHMFVARRAGMRVEKFSVGFGPTLVRWKGRKTIYQVALIPLGGYVQIAGMNPHEKLPEDDPGSYANKSAGWRFATIFAGPATNYLFAIVIMLGVMATLGLPLEQPAVAEVSKGSPAARGGLRPGDVIEAINQQDITAFTEVQQSIQDSKGEALSFRIRRGNEAVNLFITPALEGKNYRIGIAFGRKLAFRDVGLGRALLLSAYFPINVSAKALSSLGQLFTGKVSVKQMGGPLEIVRQLKMSFEDSLVMAVIFMGMLNVYLGLFNLLPVPALDGGRLIFLTFTLITRRPVNQRVENAIHTVGFFILLGLIALLTYRDAARIFTTP